MTYIVYRYEDPEGYGPFRTLSFTELSSSRHNANLKKYPTLYKDLPRYVSESWELRCGMSKRYIAYWFNSRERKELFKNGYELKKIVVSERIIGKSKKQIFYNKTHIISSKTVNYEKEIQKIPVKNRNT